MRRFTDIYRILTFPFRWPFIDTALDRKIIFAFTRWFGSIQGFKQQTMLILLWTVVDIIDPKLDPHMLQLMAFLTIYSGGTQPALAIGNEQGLQMQVQLLQNSVDQLTAMVEMLTRLQDISERDSLLLDEIAEDVENIREEFATEEELEATNAHRAAIRNEVIE